MIDSIPLTRDDDIAIITLNKAERMNALGRRMWERIGELMDELGAPTFVRK